MVLLPKDLIPRFLEMHNMPCYIRRSASIVYDVYDVRPKLELYRLKPLHYHIASFKIKDNSLGHHFTMSQQYHNNCFCVSQLDYPSLTLSPSIWNMSHFPET